MKKILLILTLLSFQLSAFNSARAQLTIPGTSVTFRLNNEDWRYLRTFELPEGGDVYLYCYVGQVVIDEEADTVLPFLRIYVNRHYDGELHDLVFERYNKEPYQFLDEYSNGPGLPESGGIGYDGVYTNPSDQKDYLFYMTYFKDRNTMVEFRLETTKDTFEEMDFEFKDILSSVK